MRFLLFTISVASLAATPAAAQRLIGPEHTGAALPSSPVYSPTAGGIPTAPVVRNRAVELHEIEPRALIADPRGYRIGRVERADADGVVVRYSGGLTRVPLKALYSDGYGLRLRLSSREFVRIAQRNPLN